MLLSATILKVGGPITSVVANQYNTRTTTKCNPTQYTKNAFLEYRFANTALVRL
jgi:hypothetical protein